MWPPIFRAAGRRDRIIDATGSPKTAGSKFVRGSAVENVTRPRSDAYGNVPDCRDAAIRCSGVIEASRASTVQTTTAIRPQKQRLFDAKWCRHSDLQRLVHNT